MDPFHIMAKPHGPICNLNCTYCYYLEKENLYAAKGRDYRMSDSVLEVVHPPVHSGAAGGCM
jgi:uncharacterized protein